MAESSNPPGWWRTGNVSARLVCLGAGLGAVGALVFQLSYAVDYFNFNPSGLIWGLYFLVLEGLVMAILGLIVAGVVIIARFFVTGAATRKARAVVTGLVALISSSALSFALFSLFPFSANPWAVGAITGVLAGSAFATVSYRHTYEA